MNRLTENHFSFKCPMNWDEMSPSANGRFCNQCQKEVFDLTNCTLDEVRDLQQKHGSICGSIKLMGAAAVAISLSAAACQNSDQKTSAEQTGGKPKSPSKVVDKPAPEIRIAGGICPPPRNPVVEVPVEPKADEDRPVVAGRIGPIPPQEKLDSPKDQ